MSKINIQPELRDEESKLLGRYTRFSKLFILIAFLLVFVMLVIFLGVFVLGYGPNWALLSLDSWIIALCALFGLFVLLELFFYYNFSSFNHKRIELEKPKPDFIDGKLVYVYTHPKGAEGGIFSKTYIEIDKHSVLRLKSLIVPPDEVWIDK